MSALDNTMEKVKEAIEWLDQIDGKPFCFITTTGLPNWKGPIEGIPCYNAKLLKPILVEALVQYQGCEKEAD